VQRFFTWLEGTFVAARRRSRRFDHVVRAVERYVDVDGGRLAAANAYYGFFAVFALAVLLVGVLTVFLKDNQLVVTSVRDYLERNLPQVKVVDLIGTTQNIGKIAVIGLALAGIGWVETLRSSQRAIWGIDEHPGNIVFRYLVDLAVLVGLGILLTVSVSIAAGVQDGLFALAGEPQQSAWRVVFNQTSTLLAFLVDLILAAGLLTGVTRLRMPMRRLFPSALLIAVGLLALKTLGRWYIARTQHNPAYQVFAGAVGLLVLTYLFSQIVLFAAALAATSEFGKVRDLAKPPVPPGKLVEPVPEATPSSPAPPASPSSPESSPQRS
jgi:membrane protein